MRVFEMILLFLLPGQANKAPLRSPQMIKEALSLKLAIPASFSELALSSITSYPHIAPHHSPH
jgi:hypothetical protein